MSCERVSKSRAISKLPVLYKKSKSGNTNVTVSQYFNFSDSAPYYGHFIGKLSNREENIFGHLYAVDKNTVFIQNFTYLDDSRKLLVSWLLLLFLMLLLLVLLLIVDVKLSVTYNVVCIRGCWCWCCCYGYLLLVLIMLWLLVVFLLYICCPFEFLF